MVALGIGLPCIIPFRRDFIAGCTIGIEHRTHMIGTQHFLLFLIELWLEVPLVHAVEHETGNLVNAQLLREVYAAL